jgi:transketolase
MPGTRASKRNAVKAKSINNKMQKIAEDDEFTPKIQDLAHVMRIDSINMTNASASGHPTSCSSMAELISTIFFHPDGMKFRQDQPRAFENDKFILSKGHAAPILYSAWSHAGHIPSGELMNLRKIDNDLEGHPTPRLDFVDVATGSLGQGLNAACGMAYSMKYFEKNGNRVYCLMGDGEMAEGSNWEAMNFASFHKLDNLVAIVDINRLGQSDATSLDHQVDVYVSRFESFGFNTISVDGHSVPEIVSALKQTKKGGDKPYAILAHTLKGKYFSDRVEDLQPWHGKPLGGESPAVIEHLKSMIKDEEVKLEPHVPEAKIDTPVAPEFKVPELKYEVGVKVAPRKAFGEALKDLGDQSELIIGVDADVKNSTMLEYLQKSKPDQFIDCFIAEQNMVGVSIGVGTRGRIPFCGTFATFFTRAFDHIRMGAISQCNVKFVGTHCGVSIGADGPSQMGLEDISMFRSIPNCVVLYPSDATSSYHAATLAANHKGMVFIRLGRPDTATFYGKDESFKIGESKVAVSSDSDKITLVVAGVTFDAALEASSALKADGINIRIVDIFSVKPMDKDTLVKSAEQTNNTILVVEDHYPEGGIYEAVCGSVASHGIKVHSLAVNGVPRSGKPAELLKMFKIDADAIVDKVKELTK